MSHYFVAVGELTSLAKMGSDAWHHSPIRHPSLFFGVLVPGGVYDGEVDSS